MLLLISSNNNNEYWIIPMKKNQSILKLKEMSLLNLEDSKNKEANMQNWN